MEKYKTYTGERPSSLFFQQAAYSGGQVAYCQEPNPGRLMYNDEDRLQLSLATLAGFSAHNTLHRPLTGTKTVYYERGFEPGKHLNTYCT
jgi:hypothetical protein